MKNPPPFEDLDLPVRAVWFGEPVFDLSKIDEERWPEVLVQVSPRARKQAIGCAPWEAQARAVAVVLDLDLEAPDRRWGIMQAPAEARTQLPVPDAAGSEGNRGRQINIRLRPDDHERLVRAAGLLALTPTQLARTFIVNGTTRVLADPG